ncbi:hypothetical protein [Streptantibioticus ferralitis]|uniref:Uncharacterized protein n=1 Tax=Streptantibioticus ferralitis TaxID=236510 RepID=A0ABT5Z1F1_9ACTN|nr:hypothetical protein [Streptantibioticus ferralitis]MDF2257401.1 hypothetical protein [Streptantibioticus ferralitis]
MVSERDHMVADLARQVLHRIPEDLLGPGELELFDETAALWLTRRGKPGSARNDMLGFGLDAALPVVTAAALTAAHTAVGFLWEATRDAVRDEASGVLRSGIDRAVARLRAHRHREGRPEVEGAGPADRPDTFPAKGLDPQRLTQVRKVAYGQLIASGTSEEMAGLLADAVVGALAVRADGHQK